MKKNTVTLSTRPLPNMVRLRVRVLKKSGEIALSFTDANDIEHRTPFTKTLRGACDKLKAYVAGTTGIGRVGFQFTEELRW